MLHPRVSYAKGQVVDAQGVELNVVVENIFAGCAFD
jgi:hypothetical protein